MSLRNPYRTTYLLIVILIALTILTGYNFVYRPFAALPEREEAVAEESIQAVPVDPLVAFSPEEQVAQLLALPVVVDDFLTSTESAALVESIQPGFVTLFGSQLSSESAKEATDKLALIDQTIAVAVDHEGGVVQRLNGPGFTALPSWQSLCSGEESTAAELLITSARELRTAGVDVVFAPMVDLAVQNRVLGNRVCSGDAALTYSRANLFITLFQSVGIEPVIKHFPGIGSTTRDTHTSSDTVSLTFADTQIFRDVLSKFPQLGTMVAHVAVTNQDAATPCSLSADCVGELQAVFPETVVFSDALDMRAARAIPGEPTREYTLIEVSLQALLAGNDVLVYGPNVDPALFQSIVEELAIAYQNDPAVAEAVQSSVLKLQEYKERR